MYPCKGTPRQAGKRNMRVNREGLVCIYGPTAFDSPIIIIKCTSIPVKPGKNCRQSSSKFAQTLFSEMQVIVF